MEIIRSPQTGDITAYTWCQIPVRIEVAQASGPQLGEYGRNTGTAVQRLASKED